MSFTRCMLLLSSFLLASLLRAQTPVDASGHWEGTIHAAEKDLTIEFDLTKNAGTFNLPARNLRALPLSNVAVHDGKVTFEIKGAQPEADRRRQDRSCTEECADRKKVGREVDRHARS